MNVTDLTGMVDYLFFSGPAPCDFISPGIAYATRDDTVSLIHDHDLGTYVNVTSVSLDIPADGIVHVLCTADVLTSGYLALAITESGGDLLRAC